MALSLRGRIISALTAKAEGDLFAPWKPICDVLLSLRRHGSLVFVGPGASRLAAATAAQLSSFIVEGQHRGSQTLASASLPALLGVLYNLAIAGCFSMVYFWRFTLCS